MFETLLDTGDREEEWFNNIYQDPRPFEIVKIIEDIFETLLETGATR